MNAIIGKLATTLLPMIVQKAFTKENGKAGTTKAAGVALVVGVGGLANYNLEIVPVNSEYQLAMATASLVASAILFFVKRWVSEHTPELDLTEEQSK